MAGNTSAKTYVYVWTALVFLTFITVRVAGVDLGGISILVALGIASTKAFLVALYFMHLKYESRVFRIMTGVVLVTLAVIIGFTFFDTALR